MKNYKFQTNEVPASPDASLRNQRTEPIPEPPALISETNQSPPKNSAATPILREGSRNHHPFERSAQKNRKPGESCFNQGLRCASRASGYQIQSPNRAASFPETPTPRRPTRESERPWFRPRTSFFRGAVDSFPLSRIESGAVAVRRRPRGKMKERRRLPW